MEVKRANAPGSLQKSPAKAPEAAPFLFVKLFGREVPSPVLFSACAAGVKEESQAAVPAGFQPSPKRRKSVKSKLRQQSLREAQPFAARSRAEPNGERLSSRDNAGKESEILQTMPVNVLGSSQEEWGRKELNVLLFLIPNEPLIAA